MSWETVYNKLQGKVQGQLLINEPLKKHNTWRVGGNAELLLIPAAAEDIRLALSVCVDEKLPLTVIGNGSNVLISDLGIKGLVLKIAAGLNQILATDNQLRAGAGVLLPQLAREAARHGLSGLEFGMGIPASVGGALYMNAGAFCQNISDHLLWVKYLSAAGELVQADRQHLNFSYRSSSFAQNKAIIIEAAWTCLHDDAGQIEARMQTFLQKRQESQPLQWPNAGCIFRNPPGEKPAGWLLEQAGCKGLQIGDAQISLKHANFIINRGEATQQQISSLINKVKEMVLLQFGIELQSEIRFLGETEFRG